MACCRTCCNKCTHTVGALIGLSLSCFELIVASVYNFSWVGSCLSVIGIVTSGLYLWFNLEKKGRDDSVDFGESTKKLVAS